MLRVMAEPQSQASTDGSTGVGRHAYEPVTGYGDPTGRRG